MPCITLESKALQELIASCARESNNFFGINTNTVGKKSTDSYSDLKNSNITLPLLYHLQEQQKRLIEEYLAKPTKPNDIDKYQLEITKDLIQSGAIKKAKRIGASIANLADNYLNTQNSSTVFLIDIVGQAKWNKYYYELKTIEKNK